MITVRQLDPQLKLALNTHDSVDDMFALVSFHALPLLDINAYLQLRHLKLSQMARVKALERNLTCINSALESCT